VYSAAPGADRRKTKTRKENNMNIDKTMMTFDEAQQNIQKAIGAGLVASGTRTKLMEAIRSKEPFVVGYRVSRLNDKVVNISKKDFNDIFPDSDDASVSVSS